VTQRRRSRISVVVRWIFGLAGLAFLVIAFRETWDRSRGTPFPGWPVLLVGTGAIIAGIVMLGAGWVRLLDRGPFRPLARAFYLSQLGKYIPGGIWQPLGQIEMTRRMGIPLAAVTASFAVFAAIEVAAGGVVGAVATLVPDARAAVRWGAALGLAPLALLYRPVLTRLLALWPRWSIERVNEVVPGAKPIVRSFLLGCANMIATSLAFAAILSQISPRGHSVVLAAACFSLAWTAGFVALPVPSGIGVREAVLLALLSGPAGAGSVIAASIVHRLMTLIAEGIVLAWSAYPVRSTTR